MSIIVMNGMLFGGVGNSEMGKYYGTAGFDALLDVFSSLCVDRYVGRMPGVFA